VLAGSSTNAREPGQGKCRKVFLCPHAFNRAEPSAALEAVIGRSGRGIGRTAVYRLLSHATKDDVPAMLRAEGNAAPGCGSQLTTPGGGLFRRRGPARLATKEESMDEPNELPGRQGRRPRVPSWVAGAITGELMRGVLMAVGGLIATAILVLLVSFVVSALF
jgi:hypothetical protein